MTHPASLLIERFSAADLPAHQMEDLRAHFAACATCRSALEALEAERRARLDFVPPAEFARRVSLRARLGARRQRRRWAAATAATLALAAALLLFVGRPWLPHVQLRGAGLTVYRLRDQRVSLLRADDKIRAGDQLRVVVLMPRAATVDGVFIDERGRIDELLAQPIMLEAGEQPLPDGLVVDRPCANGWLIVSRERLPDDDALRAAIGFKKEATIEEALPGAHVRWLQCE